MKKFIIILLGLVLAIPSFADTVSENKATDAAAAFFNKGVATRSAVKPFLVWTGGNGTRAPYAPPFYVFNNPNGGWVVISGEDSGRAILAWSDKGLFDPNDMAESTAAWFDEYANQINWARAHQLSPSDASLKEWSDLLEGRIRKTDPSEILCATPSWNQRLPYNYYCPEQNSKRTVTGCVATATAEVMWYHKWPERGHGTLPDYTYKKSSTTYNISGHELTTVYDWESMATSYPASVPASAGAGAYNVAQLIYDLGVMVQASFGTSGTGAETHRIGSGLAKYMYYDTTMRYCLRNNYTQSQWTNMMIADLTNGLPIIYGGQSEDGAHAHQFVVDGYKPSEDKFHINWGWGGYNNGWFSLQSFISYEESDSGYKEYNYRYKQDAIFNIKPHKPAEDIGATKDYKLYVYYKTSRLGFVASYNQIDKDASISKEDMIQGDAPVDSFYLYSNIMNYGLYETGDIYLRYIIADYQSDAKSVLSSKTSTSFQPSSVLQLLRKKVQLSSSPVLGDKIMVSWATDTTSIEKYNPIVGTYRTRACNDNIPLYDIPFIAVKDGGVYASGEYFDFEIVNSRTAPADMTVTWYFDDSPVETDAVYKKASRLLTTGEHTIKAVVTIGGETQTLVQKIRVE